MTGTGTHTTKNSGVIHLDILNCGASTSWSERAASHSSGANGEGLRGQE